jgi:tartrate dehydrogenase/decarboxylase / D-malate dehydrogenase
MFEPIHGSAFDIAGKDVANPIATFLERLNAGRSSGEMAAAARLPTAVEHVTSNAALHTLDLGGAATTRQVTDAVLAVLRG